jgi:hypothetical protein
MHSFLLLYPISICLLPLKQGVSRNCAVVHFGKLALLYAWIFIVLLY